MENKEKIAQLQEELNAPGTTEERKAEIVKEIEALEAAEAPEAQV